MNNRLEDFIEKTRRTANVDELQGLLVDALSQEGYDNMVFASTRCQGLHEIVWAEFPLGYVDEYRGRRWDRIDPVLQNAQRACRPFEWAEVTRPSALTSAQATFLQDCRAFGVHSGLTVPLHAPGQRVDLISVSLRHGWDTPRERLPFVYGLTVQAWLRYGELADPPETAESPILTRREIECLSWAKEGKTNWEISRILCIAERTVEFHLINTMKKLGASNRLMAIVVAIQRGLLTL